MVKITIIVHIFWTICLFLICKECHNFVTSFSLWKCRQPIKQRGHPQRSFNHQSSHVIRRRSRDQSIIHKCTQRGRRAKYFGGNGTSSAPHPCPNRQFNSGRHHKLTSLAKTHESHGHAIPLAAWSRSTSAMSFQSWTYYRKWGSENSKSFATSLMYTARYLRTTLAHWNSLGFPSYVQEPNT